MEGTAWRRPGAGARLAAGCGSINDVKRHVEDPVLEPDEVAEERRGDRRKDVARVGVVCDVEDLEAAAQLVPFQPGQEADAEVLGQLQVEREERREAKAVGLPRVILQFVIVRIREAAVQVGHRAEEHTSELQSLAYLVCRLLLEKKNKST